MDALQPHDVRVIHRYTASPERVFDAWLDPDMIGLWLLASSPDDQVIHIERDARVGGKFSFLVRRAGEEIDHVGEYRELARPRRLSFTFGVVGGGAPVASGATADLHDSKPSVVAIELAAVGTGTEVVLVQDNVPPDMRAKIRRGWAMILDAIGDMTSVANDNARATGVTPPSPVPTRAARSSR